MDVYLLYHLVALCCRQRETTPPLAIPFPTALWAEGGPTVRLEPCKRPNNERTRFGRQPDTSFLSRAVEYKLILAYWCVSDGHSDKRTENGELRTEAKPAGFRVVSNEPTQSVISASVLSARRSALHAAVYSLRRFLHRSRGSDADTYSAAADHTRHRCHTGGRAGGRVGSAA
jgi:hypothetical protein